MINAIVKMFKKHNKEKEYAKIAKALCQIEYRNETFDYIYRSIKNGEIRF